MHRSRHVSGMCELPLMNKAHANTRDAHSPEVISPKSNFSENESYRLCVPVTNRKTLKLSNKDNPSRLRAVVIISTSCDLAALWASRPFSLSRGRHEIIEAFRNFGPDM